MSPCNFTEIFGSLEGGIWTESIFYWIGFQFKHKYSIGPTCHSPSFYPLVRVVPLLPLSCANCHHAAAARCAIRSLAATACACEKSTQVPRQMKPPTPHHHFLCATAGWAMSPVVARCRRCQSLLENGLLGHLGSILVSAGNSSRHQ
jgi:hypothetical protein